MLEFPYQILLGQLDPAEVMFAAYESRSFARQLLMLHSVKGTTKWAYSSQTSLQLLAVHSYLT
jgi:hypothetical protein